MKSEETHDKQAGLPTATTDLLRILTDRVVQNFQPVRLILFGSHARGEANPHSDIDLLVVFPQASDKRQSRYVVRSPPCLCVKMSSSQLQMRLLDVGISLARSCGLPFEKAKSCMGDTHNHAGRTAHRNFTDQQPLSKRI